MCVYTCAQTLLIINREQVQYVCVHVCVRMCVCRTCGLMEVRFSGAGGRESGVSGPAPVNVAICARREGGGGEAGGRRGCSSL